MLNLEVANLSLGILLKIVIIRLFASTTKAVNPRDIFMWNGCGIEICIYFKQNIQRVQMY